MKYALAIKGVSLPVAAEKLRDMAIVWRFRRDLTLACGARTWVLRQRADNGWIGMLFEVQP